MVLVHFNQKLREKNRKEGHSYMMKSLKSGRSLAPYILSLVLLFVVLAIGSFVHPAVTHAASTSNITNAYGINGGSDSTDAIQEEVKTWMDRIRLIGFGIVLIALILGGVLFGVSLGNSNRRSIAIGACLCALLGIWMIFKTETLAGYMVK